MMSIAVLLISQSANGWLAPLLTIAQKIRSCNGKGGD
nr:MAG TPA: hypothetical protein [Caudoviricetes sp.]